MIPHMLVAFRSESVICVEHWLLRLSPISGRSVQEGVGAT